jgi:hypothetical protein
LAGLVLATIAIIPAGMIKNGVAINNVVKRVMPAALHDAVSPYTIRKDKMAIEIDDKMTDMAAGLPIL